MVRVTRAFGEVCWWGYGEGYEKGGSECEKQIKGYKEGGVWGRRGWECEPKYELRKGAKKRTECSFFASASSLALFFINKSPVSCKGCVADGHSDSEKRVGGKEDGRDFGLENAIFSPLLLYQDK